LEHGRPPLKPLLASGQGPGLVGHWCIDRTRPDWRRAGLPVDLLTELTRHDSAPGFAELIACMADHHLIADRHP
jgi:hypothetical protein